MGAVKEWEHGQNNVGVVKYRAGRHVRQIKGSMSSTLGGKKQKEAEAISLM